MQLLIQELEKLNPNDPSPETTRALLMLLRVCEESGKYEMLETIDRYNNASYAALRAIGIDCEDATKAMKALTVANAEVWLKEGQGHNLKGTRR
jgi:hypothetical protein